MENMKFIIDEESILDTAVKSVSKVLEGKIVSNDYAKFIINRFSSAVSDNYRDLFFDKCLKNLSWDISRFDCIYSLIKNVIEEAIEKESVDFDNILRIGNVEKFYKRLTPTARISVVVLFNGYVEVTCTDVNVTWSSKFNIDPHLLCKEDICSSILEKINQVGFNVEH